MKALLPLLLALGLAAPVPAVPAPAKPAAATPERIVSMRVRTLDRARYQELRDEWRAYTKAHPRDPLGWSQLARAANYSGAPCDECAGYARKAVQIAPNDPEALIVLARFDWSVYCGAGPDDPREAIGLLERALKLDPRMDEPRYYLWFMRLAQGRRDLADEQLRVLIDSGRMPEPLVDFGHNLLAGLEPNAILITNGDNDTYPTLALQAARHLRPDVTVINQSCANLPWYRRQIREGTPGAPIPLLENMKEGLQAPAAVKGLAEALAKDGWKRPLYIAVTVPNCKDLVPNTLSLEGLVYRVRPETGGGIVTDRARLERNLDHVYRLQSATSVAMDWDEWSSLAILASNYSAAWYQLAHQAKKDGDLDAARASMGSALEILSFHRSLKQGPELLEAWAKVDPDAPQLPTWRAMFKP